MLSGAYVRAWLLAFLVTQAVEAPIYLAAFGRPLRPLRSLAPSALTHPLLWFVLAPLWAGPYWSFVLFGEGFVVLAEALLLWRLGLRRPWIWSPVANGASFAVGLLLAHLHLL